MGLLMGSGCLLGLVAQGEHSQSALVGYCRVFQASLVCP